MSKQQASETLDADPAGSLVDLAKLNLMDTTGGGGNPSVSLGGATIGAQEHTTILVTLTELQRVTAIAFSGTQGGDGSAVVLDVAAGAFQDMATNVIEADLNNVVVETRDERRPSVVAIAVDYNDGSVVLTVDETVDSTPRSNVDPALFFIAQASQDQEIGLGGATVTEIDAVTLSLSLTELQRVRAIAISGTSGCVTCRQVACCLL